jgi:hypothetical protein
MAGWSAECVSSRAGFGQEAEASPLCELGEHDAGVDTEPVGKFSSWPVTVRFGGHDLGDLLAAGRRPVRVRRAGLVLAGPALAGRAVRGRGEHGDLDVVDGGGLLRAAVVAVEVAGGGALDLAGAGAVRFFRKSPVPGPAPRRVHHPWNPPEAELPGIAAIDTLYFDRSEQAAVAIIAIAAYARGFEFFLARRIRPGTPGLDKDPTPEMRRRQHRRPGRPAPARRAHPRRVRPDLRGEG